MHRTVPVIVETWQFECCGDPFAVGDRVAWQLSIDTDPDQPPIATTELAGSVGDVLECEASGTRGNLLTSGGLTVWVVPERAAGPAELTGTLAQDHHGLIPEAALKNSGTITRVRAISVIYERHDRTLTPIPGTERLRDVAGFADWQASYQDDESSNRGEPSLLVDLQIHSSQ